MAAGTWTFTDVARTRMLNGTFEFDIGTFKVALFLSTSHIGAASRTYAGVTNEHANARVNTVGANRVRGLRCEPHLRAGVSSLHPGVRFLVSGLILSPVNAMRLFTGCRLVLAHRGAQVRRRSLRSPVNITVL